YAIDQNYLDPWRGFINNEERIRLGRTEPAGAWTVDAASSVNSMSNVITQTGLDYMNRFTGLTNGTIPYPPTDSSHTDTTNMGTRFWVGYGHNNNVTTFIAKMGGASQDANVTVKVHGTDWVRNYHIPANTFINSDPIPRTGASGAVLLTEGISDRGISIESDVPVSAFVEASGMLAVTGSTMLLPVGSFGYEYYSLAWEQKNYDVNVYSWFYVIADHDSTMVEITPANPTLGGRTPNVPFVVTLNKGEVYQVLGARKSENDGYDLSGSKVRSLSNLSGKCYPVAVFSGNSRAFIDCAESFVPFGNYLIQQGSPAETWGTQYLTAPTTKMGDPTSAQTNFYRILVKDPATVVRVNGLVLGNRINNYYQYQSNTADYIEATKPVLVAEYIPGSSNVCNYGSTAPEMFYVPAIDQGIRKAALYRSNISNFGDNYLTVIIPNKGLSTLTIDGTNTFDATYSHPNKTGYSVVLKRWQPADATSTVQSDSAFIALNYGLGGINSYGVLAGKAIPATPALPGITNIYDSSGHYSAFTCVGTPFRYSVLLPVIPTSITWKFSQRTNMVPNVDSVQLNPVPLQTELVNGHTYYRFTLNKEYVFPTADQYIVPIEYVHPVIASCTNTAEAILTITVAATPVVDIDAATSGCVGDSVLFSATVTGSFGDVVHQLTWNFDDNTTAVALTPSKLYAGAGTYTVKVDAITKVGCIASAVEPLVLKGPSVFEFVSDTVKGCAETNVTLAIKNPQTGVVYNWYDAATGGAPVQAGTTMTIAAIKATKTYYIDATADGCTTRPRKPVTALYLTGVSAPVVRADSIGAQMIRFSWSVVPGVTNYQVSINGGITWVAPSTGATGLQHMVTGLQPGQIVTIRVKAVDPNGCTDGIAEAGATTIMEDVFVPNAFTPNGDNLNDVFKIEGFVVKSMQLRVFNQWGEMIFESADQSKGWDGSYKGKWQPSGVYMYVCSMVLQDGSKLVKKGSVNLVR
ncbi:MAG TPA: gliding motility-associated C-terminal domain-containing protein, partial [Niastella sp.]